MSLVLTVHQKLYLADICQEWIDDHPGVEQESPKFYEVACKVIDWVEATQ